MKLTANPAAEALAILLEPDPELTTLEVSRSAICLAAAPGLVRGSGPPDWKTLGELPWIYATSSTCCGRTAESLFTLHQMRPKRIVSVDRESVTRTLIASRVGVGLLHLPTASEAEARGEIQVLFQTQHSIRVLFAYLASRARDPILNAVSSTVRARNTTDSAQSPQCS